MTSYLIVVKAVSSFVSGKRWVNCGDLRVVRVGRKSHIHPFVYDWSVDRLIKQEIDKREQSSSNNLGQLREQLTNLNKDLDAAEKERHSFHLLKRTENVSRV